MYLRNRFQTASLTARSITGLGRISARTVCNRLREHNIRPRRPVIRPLLLQRHRTALVVWCRRPAVSPDLSPIEHVWDEMERRLRRLPNQH